MNKVIEAKNLTRIYQMGEVEVRAINGINLAVKKGEFLSIMGASGSGKSTLMNLIGCLDRATSGECYLEGENVNDYDKNELADLRNQKIGFVFQTFNLLPRTTAIENVELPILYNRKEHIENSKERAINVLKRVGLGNRVGHLPSQLSGGQQQRVAIARALVNNPSIILADEPTGNLDSATSHDILQLFQELNREGITIIMVTHERDFAVYTRRIISLVDGKVDSDKEIENLSMPELKI